MVMNITRGVRPPAINQTPVVVQPARASLPGVTRDIRPSEIIKDVRGQVISDSSKFVRLGDGALVDRQTFDSLPVDAQTAGKTVGLKALQMAVEIRNQAVDNILGKLKPYTDDSGSIRLAEALKAGAVTEKELLDYDVFDPQAVTNTMRYNEVLHKLEPYKVETQAEGGQKSVSYDIAKYLRDESQGDLEAKKSDLRAAGYDDETIQKVEDYNAALNKLEPYKTADGNYNILGYLSKTGDTAALKTLGFKDEDIQNVQQYLQSEKARQSWVPDVGGGAPQPYYDESGSLIVPYGADVPGATLKFGEVEPTRQSSNVPPPFGTPQYTEWYYGSPAGPGYNPNDKVVSVDRDTGSVKIINQDTGESKVVGMVTPMEPSKDIPAGKILGVSGDNLIINDHEGTSKTVPIDDYNRFTGNDIGAQFDFLKGIGVYANDDYYDSSSKRIYHSIVVGEKKLTGQQSFELSRLTDDKQIFGKMQEFGVIPENKVYVGKSVDGQFISSDDPQQAEELKASLNRYYSVGNMYDYPKYLRDIEGVKDALTPYKVEMIGPILPGQKRPTVKGEYDILSAYMGTKGNPVPERGLSLLFGSDYVDNIKDRADLLVKLKPYTDRFGEVNYLAALKSGDVASTRLLRTLSVDQNSEFEDYINSLDRIIARDYTMRDVNGQITVDPYKLYARELNEEAENILLKLGYNREQVDELKNEVHGWPQAQRHLVAMHGIDGLQEATKKGELPYETDFSAGIMNLSLGNLEYDINTLHSNLTNKVSSWEPSGALMDYKPFGSASASASDFLKAAAAGGITAGIGALSIVPLTGKAIGLEGKDKVIPAAKELVTAPYTMGKSAVETLSNPYSSPIDVGSATAGVVMLGMMGKGGVGVVSKINPFGKVSVPINISSEALNINRVKSIIGGIDTANTLAKSIVAVQDAARTIKNLPQDIVSMSKKLPTAYEVTIGRINDVVEVGNKASDYLLSGNLSKDALSVVRNTKNVMSTELFNLREGVGSRYEASIRKINDMVEPINTLADNIMSGKYSNDIKVSMASLRDSFLELRENAKNLPGLYYDVVYRTFEPINIAVDNVMFGRLSEGLKNQLYNGIDTVKLRTQEVILSTKENYNLAVDRLNDALENINVIADNIMSGKYGSDIKRQLVELKNSLANIKQMPGVGLRRVTKSLDDAVYKLDVINKLADNIMSGKYSDSMKNATREFIDNTRANVDLVYNQREIRSQLNEIYQGISDSIKKKDKVALEKYGKQLEDIASSLPDDKVELSLIDGDRLVNYRLPNTEEFINNLRKAEYESLERLKEYSVNDIAKVDAEQIRELKLSDATDIPTELADDIQNYIQNNNGKIYGSFVDWLKVKQSNRPHDIDVVFENAEQAKIDIANLAKGKGYDVKITDKAVNLADGKTIVNIVNPKQHASMFEGRGYAPVYNISNEGVQVETLGTQVLNQAFATLEGGRKFAQRAERMAKVSPEVIEGAVKSGVSPVGAKVVWDLGGDTIRELGKDLQKNYDKYLEITETQLEYPSGEVDVWKGFQIGGRPVVGVSKGRLVWGGSDIVLPPISEWKVGSVEGKAFEPQTSLETRVLVNKEALERAGVSAESAEKLVKDVESTTTEAKKFYRKTYPYLDVDVLSQPIDTFSKEGVETILKHIVEEKDIVDKVFGSSTIRPQLRPEIRQNWEEIFSRLPGDIDIRLKNVDATGAADFAKRLVDRINAETNDKVSISKEKPTLIEAESRIKYPGKKRHAIDIHYEGEEIDPFVQSNVGEYSYGLKIDQPAINVNIDGIGNVKITRLSETGVSKMNSVLEWRSDPNTGEIVLKPAQHRLKDYVDLYTIIRAYNGESNAIKWSQNTGINKILVEYLKREGIAEGVNRIRLPQINDMIKELNDLKTDLINKNINSVEINTKLNKLKQRSVLEKKYDYDIDYNSIDESFSKAEKGIMEAVNKFEDIVNKKDINYNIDYAINKLKESRDNYQNFIDEYSRQDDWAWEFKPSDDSKSGIIGNSYISVLNPALLSASRSVPIGITSNGQIVSVRSNKYDPLSSSSSVVPDTKDISTSKFSEVESSDSSSSLSSMLSYSQSGRSPSSVPPSPSSVPTSPISETPSPSSEPSGLSSKPSSPSSKPPSLDYDSPHSPPRYPPYGIPPVWMPKESKEDQYKRLSETPAVVEWRHGRYWVALPPRDDGSYHDEDMEFLDKPLPGTYKFATGPGSAAKTIQVLNGVPVQPADVDIGWAKIRIEPRGKDVAIRFSGGDEAIATRWEQEKQEKIMDDLARESYKDIPRDEIVQRIKIPRAPSQPRQKLADRYGGVLLEETDVKNQPLKTEDKPLRTSKRTARSRKNRNFSERYYLGRQLREPSLGTI